MSTVEIQTGLRTPKSDLRRLVGAGLFAAIALTVASFVWYVAYRDDCATVASWKFCEFSRHLFERALGVGLLCGLVLAARHRMARPVLDAARRGIPPASACFLALTGALLIALPLAFWGSASSGGPLLAGVTLWATGVLLVAAAALRLAAPWGAWIATAHAGGLPLALCVALGTALPELGDTLFPLWHEHDIKATTFAAVQWAAGAINLTLTAIPAEYTIGQGAFWVEIGQSCSGIEGFALITVFLSAYALLFRRQLVTLRVAAILPLALALSWGFNIVRITLLIWIGVNVSPTLAVEGFHSHAGWLTFVCLSMAMIAVVHQVPWFQRDLNSPAACTLVAPPLSADWNAARILPFAVFMFSALLASTFVQDPAQAYPLRALGMAAALWVFRTQLAGIAWRADPVAIGCGLVVGLGWLAIPAAGAEPIDAFGPATLGPLFLAIWVFTRIVGTTLLVPVIEELFFRSYLLERLGANRSTARTMFAITLSTAAFAVLHDRVLLAACAGLIFACLTLRRSGRLSDAIVAHMTANTLIASWALLTSDWTVI